MSDLISNSFQTLNKTHKSTAPVWYIPAPKQPSKFPPLSHPSSLPAGSSTARELRVARAAMERAGLHRQAIPRAVDSQADCTVSQPESQPQSQPQSKSKSIDQHLNARAVYIDFSPLGLLLSFAWPFLMVALSLFFRSS